MTGEKKSREAKVPLNLNQTESASYQTFLKTKVNLVPDSKSHLLLLSMMDLDQLFAEVIQ